MCLVLWGNYSILVGGGGNLAHGSPAFKRNIWPPYRTGLSNSPAVCLILSLSAGNSLLLSWRRGDCFEEACPARFTVASDSEACLVFWKSLARLKKKKKCHSTRRQRGMLKSNQKKQCFPFGGVFNALSQQKHGLTRARLVTCGGWIRAYVFVCFCFL